MGKIIQFGEDYHDKFNTQTYLESYFSDLSSEIHLIPLPFIHQFYQSFDSDKKLKILDVGAGPSIINFISAALLLQRLFFLSTLKIIVRL